jgi:TolA-binding protein
VVREGRLGRKDAESFERHRRVCPACAAAQDRDGRLRALGRELPATDPGQLALRRLRARILRDVATGDVLRPPPSWHRLALASTLLAGFVVASGVMATRGSLPDRSATTANVAVSPSPHPSASGTAAALLEGRPEAPADSSGNALVVVPEPVAAPPPAAPRVFPHGTLSIRAPGSSASGDVASSYVEAMRSLREGRYEAAATGFHAFVLDHPRESQAEDASFLEAVALAEAGRPDAAALAAERHLERFPQSFRSKEASILVARAASRRGRCDEARSALAPWIADGADDDVQAAIRSCRQGLSPR